MEAYSPTMIVVGDIKEALLYYDYIIPFAPVFVSAFAQVSESQVTSSTSMHIRSHWDLAFLKEILPAKLFQDDSFLNKASIFTQFLGLERGELLIRQNQPHLTGKRSYVTCNLPEKFQLLATEFDLQTVPIDCPDLLFTQESHGEGEAALTLIGLSLIDVTNTPLEQIMELRKDREAREKLRKFRIFAYDNYTGKPKTYIEDDIQMRLAGYHNVVKSWGFETKLKSLSFVLNSKMLPTCLGASFLSAMFGSTVQAVAAAATGVGLEIGRYTLELGKQNHELRKICRENPISYIADAKKALEQK